MLRLVLTSVSRRFVLPGRAAPRRKRRAWTFAACLLASVPLESARGDYDLQVGQPGSLGIPKASPAFTEWASTVVAFARGPQDISNPNSPLASFGDPANALGR